MSVIETLAIGAPLARRVEREHAVAWRVAARFEHTLWLSGSTGALCAVTTHANPGAHRAVVAALPQWPLGAGVTGHGRALAHNGIAISWNARAVWDPHPRPFRLSARERRDAVARLADMLAAAPLPEANGFWDWLASRWDDALEALRQRDTAALAPFLCNLIGRGPGLTPAGDDVTQGLYLTLHCDTDSDRGFLRELRSMVEPCLWRTTPLSGQCIGEALDGMAFGALKALLDDLPRVRAERVAALLSNGVTSGTACALGILLALDHAATAAAPPHPTICSGPRFSATPAA